MARPLAELLIERGVNVWYDDFTLTVGDGLRRSIDRGLAGSRFGVIILSPDFFRKEWPQAELDGLVAKQRASGAKVILPIWHRVTKDDVLGAGPTLADLKALNTGRDDAGGDSGRDRHGGQGHLTAGLWPPPMAGPCRALAEQTKLRCGEELLGRVHARACRSDCVVDLVGRHRVVVTRIGVLGLVAAPA